MNGGIFKSDLRARSDPNIAQNEGGKLFARSTIALTVDLVVLCSTSLASALFHFTLASFSLGLAKVELRFSLVHTIETSTKPEDFN